MAAEKRYTVAVAVAQAHAHRDCNSFLSGMCCLPLVHLQKIVRQAYPLLAPLAPADIWFERQHANLVAKGCKFGWHTIAKSCKMFLTRKSRKCSVDLYKIKFK